MLRPLFSRHVGLRVQAAAFSTSAAAAYSVHGFPHGSVAEPQRGVYRVLLRGAAGSKDQFKVALGALNCVADAPEAVQAFLHDAPAIETLLPSIFFPTWPHEDEHLRLLSLPRHQPDCQEAAATLVREHGWEEAEEDIVGDLRRSTATEYWGGYAEDRSVAVEESVFRAIAADVYINALLQQCYDMELDRDGQVQWQDPYRTLSGSAGMNNWFLGMGTRVLQVTNRIMVTLASEGLLPRCAWYTADTATLVAACAAAGPNRAFRFFAAMQQRATAYGWLLSLHEVARMLLPLTEHNCAAFDQERMPLAAPPELVDEVFAYGQEWFEKVRARQSCRFS